MKAPVFKDLEKALTQSTDWAAIDHAWQESQALTDALRRQIAASLMPQVVQVRRGDPLRGIRGSQVTVVTTTAAAAVKLRMALADWPEKLRQEGFGIQQIKVVAQPQQSLATGLRPPPKRPPIPEQAREAFASLAKETSSESLRRALERLLRPRTTVAPRR
jgi:hypothetical protein